MSATPGLTPPSPAKLVVRTLKLGISMIYFAGSALRRGLARLFGRNQAGTAVVLYYHGVPRRYQPRFEEQMRLIAARTRPVALSGLNSLPENSQSVAVTFDDAVESFAENAVPALERWKIPAAVFAVADQLDTRPDWGDSYYPPEERLMSAERLRSLPDLISVGSHTMTHPDLVGLSSEAAATEIAQSRKKLESLLQRPVAWFCFPYGSFNDSTVRLCRDAGYDRAFTTEPALVRGNGGEFVVGRIEADPWDWRAEFRLKILGAYCWQPWARALKRRLVGTKLSHGIAGPERLQDGAKPVGF